MSTGPVDPSHSDVIGLTAILNELTSVLAAGGFGVELRDPYREYGTNLAGRDLKISRTDVPAYYAAVKAIAEADGTRLVAHSATYLAPGFVRRVWSPGKDLPGAYGEIAQFITQGFNDFRAAETAHRAS